ncbi:hypothetical protein GQ42DRAFT_178314 [Ramicandelaber brevisporus]|nr:hypothetical protein GQ42DRAFT_178314 [Ramicandelaber brevisporus]
MLRLQRRQGSISSNNSSNMVFKTLTWAATLLLLLLSSLSCYAQQEPPCRIIGSGCSDGCTPCGYFACLQQPLMCPRDCQAITDSSECRMPNTFNSVTCQWDSLAAQCRYFNVRAQIFIDTPRNISTPSATSPSPSNGPVVGSPTIISPSPLSPSATDSLVSSPSSSPSSSSPSDPIETTNVSPGAIAGVIVGSACGALAILGFMMFFCRHRVRKTQRASSIAGPSMTITAPHRAKRGSGGFKLQFSPQVPQQPQPAYRPIHATTYHQHHHQYQHSQQQQQQYSQQHGMMADDAMDAFEEVKEDDAVVSPSSLQAGFNNDMVDRSPTPLYVPGVDYRQSSFLTNGDELRPEIMAALGMLPEAAPAPALKIELAILQ